MQLNERENAPNQERQGCLRVGAITLGRVCVHFFVAMVVFFALMDSLSAIAFFKRREIEFEGLTYLVQGWANWMAYYWFIAMPILLIIDGGVMAGLQSFPRNTRWLARVWFATIVVAGLVIQSLVIWAIVLPLQRAPIDDHQDEATTGMATSHIDPE